MVAVQSPDVAFIVLLAGPGVTGEEILYLQGELIAKAGGVSDEAIAKNRALEEQTFALVKQEPDNATAEKKLREIFKIALAQLSEEEKTALGVSEAALDVQIKQVLSPWFRFFLTYDPIPTLLKVKCPVLALNGGHDLQVPPQQNLPAIVEALEKGGHRDYTIAKLPNLNHLLQTSQTGAPSEYAQIEETMAPAALKIIGDWILAQVENP